MNKHVIGLATAPLIVAGMAGAIVSPVFAEGPEPRPCAELQDAINAAPDDMQTSIFVTGDCSENIRIPSHKNIFIDFGGGFHSNELIDFNGDEYGDTITVEEGAFVYLRNGTLTNGSDGKTIIKNSGLTVVDANLAADNGAYSIINNGEVNIVETTATGFRVDNSGILRIAHGTIDNADEAQPYVTGCINCENGDAIASFTIPDFIPVGFTMKYAYGNPQYQATFGTKIGCEDSDILEITGSTLDGYNLAAKRAGEADVYGTNWMSAMGKIVRVYDVESNTSGLVNKAIRDYLVNTFGTISGDLNGLQQAVENGESISVDLNIEELAADDINEEELAKIDEVLDDGKAIAYSDISLAVNASESGLIEEIAFLGGCAVSSEGKPYCEETPVVVKWGGLDLGSPAAGYKRNFYVIRLHDGRAEKIAAEVDKDGNLVFPSGKFSIYVAAYEDVEITAEDGSNEDTSVSAEAGTPDTGTETQTGKNTVLSLLGCMAAGIALALTMLPKIRKYLETRKA